MEPASLDATLGAVDSCLARVNWRMRVSSKRRLENDILALCTGLRAVVLVDYGGMLPELQDKLVALFRLLRKESTILLPLRLMVIDDMIYIIHLKGLAELASSSLSLDPNLFFVDIEHDPPKMLLYSEQNEHTSSFLPIPKLFCSFFPVDVDVNELPVEPATEETQLVEDSGPKDDDFPVFDDHTDFQSSELIVLTGAIKHTGVSLPTINGWLLGYPTIYFFKDENGEDAIYNLSTQSLNVYKVLVSRNQTASRTACEAELLSFTVPVHLSSKQEKEPWAEAFLQRMLDKLELNKQVWQNIRMEIIPLSHPTVLLSREEWKKSLRESD